MKSMREILEEKYPDILTFGCSAHLMNLVEKDVTPITVMKHIIEVHKYFRNVHQAHVSIEKGWPMPYGPMPYDIMSYDKIWY